jgi:hypothetical protein
VLTVTYTFDSGFTATAIVSDDSLLFESPHDPGRLARPGLDEFDFGRSMLEMHMLNTAFDAWLV